MAIIHMETEQTVQIAQQIYQICEQSLEDLQTLTARMNGLDWSGTSRDLFLSNYNQLVSKINQFLDKGLILSDRVNREVEEWLDIDNSTKYSDIIPIVMPPYPPIDPNSDFGEVLGAADPNGKLNENPGLLDWLKQIFDMTKDIFGKDNAKGWFARWLKGLDTIFKGGELIKSSNDINSTAAKYNELLNVFGSSDPRTLAARHAYSAAEVEQLFGVSNIPGDFFAKLGGKWDTLIDMYEQAKYKGPSLQNGMNIFNPPTVE
jgi:uncharacterized protein YukE